jgi:hypothetical protein
MNVDFGYQASTNGAGASDQGEPAGRLPSAAELARTRPEVLVGTAFAGGLIVAFLLRRLGH